MQSFVLNVNDDAIPVKSQDIDSMPLPVESWRLSTALVVDESSIKHKDHVTKTKPIDGEKIPIHDDKSIVSDETKQCQPYKSALKVDDEEKEESLSEDSAPELASILWAPKITKKTRSRITNYEETDSDEEDEEEYILELSFDDGEDQGE